MEVEEREDGSRSSQEEEEIPRREAAQEDNDDDSWSNEDDFGDFERSTVSVSAAPPLPPPTPVLSVQDIIHSIEPKVVTVIASNFKEVAPHNEEKDDPLLVDEGPPFEEDPLWSHLVSSSHESLCHFSWSSSKANANLMSSLQIDSRNILYDGKWKSRTLPSFMESTPQLLEPTKVDAKSSSNSNNASHKKSSEEGEEQSVLPVEFDWKDSCLTNPLENNQEGIHSTLDFLLANYAIDSSLKELQQYYNSSQVPKNEKTATIIDSFPLLNFMQSSTLIFPINGMDPKL